MKMNDIFGEVVTEEMIKEKIIENSKISKVRNKYSLLRQEISKKNDPKFVKKSKEKLYYLQNFDEIDISADIGMICRYELDMLDKIIDEVATDLSYDGKMRENLRILRFLAATVADTIYHEYFKLLKSKNITEDEYFSNIDYINISEICELLEVYEDYYYDILKNLKEIIGEEALEKYTYTLYFDECLCNIFNYLEWIFSDSDMKEQPDYYL